MRKQDINFRREQVSIVMQRWRAAESCSLIGVGSVGKSNLLHHLADPDVHHHYMGDEAEQFKAIIIDPNLLIPIADDAPEQFRCWAAYELMMHRLYLSFYPLNVLGEERHQFVDTYEILQDGSNPLYAYMGLRYFELGLEFFMRRGIKIVFMFDEFEEIMRKMPAKFFQTLRGLRDNYKSQLAYLTFSREPIPIMVKNFNQPELEIEPFTELFTDNLYYVGPYNQADATKMVERLNNRNQQQSAYSNYAIDFLLFATGRFAGILRAGFRELKYLGNITPSDINNADMIRRLAARRPIYTECETIWKSLTDVEQQVLVSIVRQESQVSHEIEQIVPMLVQKHLLSADRENQRLIIEPPVFWSFVERIAYN